MVKFSKSFALGMVTLALFSFRVRANSLEDNRHTDNRPNIVMIVADDHGLDAIGGK